MSIRGAFVISLAMHGVAAMAAAYAVAGERPLPSQPNPLNGPVHILSQER